MTEVRASSALSIEDLTVTFGHGSRESTVLNAVTINISAGSTVGLVGESGSGKTTVAKAVVGIVEPRSGTIRLDGVDLSTLSRKQRLSFRRNVQMIPQDSYSSLNPRRTIGQTLAESIDPARGNVGRHRDRIAHWLELVRMDPDSMDRFPHEFSGGQRQRVAIARALIIEPKVLIADEITSSLDVSVQAEILSLIAQLSTELNLTMLFISHNLAVVRQVSDEVVVLFRGTVVEHSDSESLFTAPRHEYTRALLAAVPGSPSFDIDTVADS
jgi:ABC-type dipeptide/oligopeptide/nickel transport system ATPase subunit